MSISTALLRKKDHATEAWSLTALAKCCRDLSMNTLHRENKFFAISIHIFLSTASTYGSFYMHIYIAPSFCLWKRQQLFMQNRYTRQWAVAVSWQLRQSTTFFYHTLKYEKPLKRNMQLGNPCRIVYGAIFVIANRKTHWKLYFSYKIQKELVAQQMNAWKFNWRE